MTIKTRESLLREIQTAQAELAQLRGVRASTLTTNPNADMRVFDTQLIPQAEARVVQLINQLREGLQDGTLVDPSARQRPVAVTQRPARPRTTSTTNQTTTAPSAPSAPASPSTSSPGITPYIASIESFDPRIQYELLRRTKSSEMADVYMPFVKLTSLSKVLSDNLTIGSDACDTSYAYCPSLGIHGEKEVSFDDIYNPRQGNRSIVGYATEQKTHNRVPVLVTQADADNDPPNIPMPGITKMSTERTTAGSMGVRGGLFKATIDIRAYSTGQVNTLLRYFLRPATRVMLELGHQHTNNREAELAQAANGIRYQKFDWNRSREQIEDELKPLVTLRESQRSFIEKYIYGNFGNYEIFIGYVVDFKLKFTKENVYEIQLIVHSLQQFEVPIAGTGIQSLNQGNAVPDKCKVIEIKDYFDPPSGWKTNSFAQLMAKATSPSPSISVPPVTGGTNWNEHVIPLRGAGSAPGAGGNSNPGYLISWEFFVNILLNDETSGILSVFQTTPTGSNDTVEFLRNSVLGKISSEPTSVQNSLNSNEVTWSPSLRSTDPDVMVIYNSSANGGDTSTADAVELASKLEQFNIADEAAVEAVKSGFGEGSYVKDRIKNSPINSFSEVGNGTSYLTKGVWLNTNAIIDAFTGADTISTALNNLLIKMNNATAGFWNLQIMSADIENRGLHVIDMGLSKKIESRPDVLTNKIILDQNILGSASDITTIEDSLKKLSTFDKDRLAPKYLYMFNRGLATKNRYDTGGELLDITLESALPNVIAVQAIAGVGGQMQRGTLEAIDINQLRNITLFSEVYPTCQSGSSTDTCPDPENKGVTSPKGMPDSVVREIRSLIRNGRLEPNQSVNASLEQKVDAYAGVCEQLFPATENESATNKKRRQECEKQRRADAAQFIEDVRTVARETYETKRPGYLDLVNRYGARFGSVLDLIEYDVTKLQKDLDKDSVNQKVHPFNSSNLTKTTVDLTMPGIGGIQLFQAFGVDRVPSILERGYYVVTRVNHEFGDSGWITKIQGRFRYNPEQKSTNQRQPCPTIGTCK